MNKKIIIVGIIGIMIFGGVATASTYNIIENIRSSDRGLFECSLSINDNERPFLNLEGTFNTRGRIKIVQGTEENRFNGIFRGNTFMIRTQIRERVQTIIGQCRFNEDNSFAGAWSSRILQNRGVINGAFSLRGSNNERIELSNLKETEIQSYDNDVFNAELGMNKNKEPLINLEGMYQIKNKLIFCKGTANIKDKETRFNGVFRGNHFTLKIFVEKKPFLIIGKYKFEENNEDFQGLWIWGFKDKKHDWGIGWISGTFN
jgi:hypothetical protein